MAGIGAGKDTMRIVGLLLIAIGIVGILLSIPPIGAEWTLGVVPALFLVAALVAGAVLFGCGVIAARLPPAPRRNRLAEEIERRARAKPLELRDRLPG